MIICLLDTYPKGMGSWLGENPFQGKVRVHDLELIGFDVVSFEKLVDVVDADLIFGDPTKSGR
jgi:hypothetical protein